MKRNTLLLGCIIIIIHSLSAQEMQISGGPEFDFGAFQSQKDFAFTDGMFAYLVKEDITAASQALGLSFSVRRFLNPESPITSGFVFRDSALIVTNYKQSGLVTVNDYAKGISESYGISDDFVISTMNFDLGYSSRYVISKHLQFYADLGINFTIMDAEIEKDYTLNYWGVGLFSALALQVNLPKPVYLEFGINSIINVLSSQKGSYSYETQKVDFEDAGRGWDLVSVGLYIHVGWRIDLGKMWGQMLETY